MYQVSAINRRQARTPIPQRTYRSRLPGITPDDFGRHNCPLEYKCYSETNIASACAAIKEGLRFRRAQKEFRVPHSTQRELVNFLIGCAWIGYAHTHKQVMAIVESLKKEELKLFLVMDGG